MITEKSEIKFSRKTPNFLASWNRLVTNLIHKLKNQTSSESSNKYSKISESKAKISNFVLELDKNKRLSFMKK